MIQQEIVNIIELFFFTNPEDKWNSIEVGCFDWSEKLEIRFGDKLTVGIKTQIFQKFTVEEAYK